MYSSTFEAIASPIDGILDIPSNFSLLYMSSRFEDKFSMTSAVRLYALALKTAFILLLFLCFLSISPLYLLSILSFPFASNSIRYAIWRKTFDIAELLVIYCQYILLVYLLEFFITSFAILIGIIDEAI